MTNTYEKNYDKGIKRNKSLGSDLTAKLPPHDKSIEESVLGAVLLEKTALNACLELIRNEDVFYKEENSIIYAKIIEMSSKNLDIDIITLTLGLKNDKKLDDIGGAHYITLLTMSVISTAHIEGHCRVLLELFMKRELIRISNENLLMIYSGEDVFDVIQQNEYELMKLDNSIESSDVKHISGIVKENIEYIDNVKEGKYKIQGVPSGYKTLDAITNGWQNQDLIILAARPSVGKTALALNFALNPAKLGIPIAIFSLEMSNKSLANRLMSTNSNVPLEYINRASLSDNNYAKLVLKSGELSSYPIYIDETGSLNMFQLKSKARRLVLKNGVKLIIIDYLQLMTGNIKSGNREQEISGLSRGIKALAKELDIPIIVLSQLSRQIESRADKRPQLSDLRESGAIEQDADMVIFPTREDYGNNDTPPELKGMAELIISKHRNGKLETIPMRTNLSTQLWYEEDIFSEEKEHYNPFAGIRNNHDKDKLNEVAPF